MMNGLIDVDLSMSMLVQPHSLQMSVVLMVSVEMFVELTTVEMLHP